MSLRRTACGRGSRCPPSRSPRHRWTATSRKKRPRRSSASTRGHVAGVVVRPQSSRTATARARRSRSRGGSRRTVPTFGEPVRAPPHTRRAAVAGWSLAVGGGRAGGRRRRVPRASAKLIRRTRREARGPHNAATRDARCTKANRWLRARRVRTRLRFRRPARRAWVAPSAARALFRGTRWRCVAPRGAGRDAHGQACVEGGPAQGVIDAEGPTRRPTPTRPRTGRPRRWCRSKGPTSKPATFDDVAVDRHATCALGTQGTRWRS